MVTNARRVIRAVRRISLVIVQRIAEHRTVFHAGCVSPADAGKRIALARNVERPSWTPSPENRQPQGLEIRASPL